MACDPNQLVADAKCFLCIDQGMQVPVMLSLLCQIRDGGGGGPCTPCPPCPQDYLISWTPTSFALPETMSWTNLDEGGNPLPLTGMTSLTLRATHYDTDMVLIDMTTVLTISFPNLVTFTAGAGGQGLQIQDNTLLTSITAPHLTAINGAGASLTVSNPKLTACSFPALVTINNGVSMTFNAVLPLIDLTALVTVPGGMIINQNVVLKTISVPSWIPTPTSNSDFTSNSLLAATVNQILARHVASLTWGAAGETLGLQGGTNAAPTGQGVADKATLIGRGANVNTN